MTLVRFALQCEIVQLLGNIFLTPIFVRISVGIVDCGRGRHGRLSILTSLWEGRCFGLLLLELLALARLEVPLLSFGGDFA